MQILRGPIQINPGNIPEMLGTGKFKSFLFQIILFYLWLYVILYELKL